MDKFVIIVLIFYMIFRIGGQLTRVEAKVDKLESQVLTLKGDLILQPSLEKHEGKD